MTNDYWAYAHGKVGVYPKHTSRGGKWLIFVGDRSLDNIWAKIKIAVEEGRLGEMAKTVAKKFRDHDSSMAICVYTYDWKDHEDARRVREELRKIGVIRKIPYKSDEETELGIYHKNNKEKVSKYYE